MEETSWSTSEDYIRLSQFSCPEIVDNLRPKNVVTLTNVIQQIKDINYSIPEGSPVERHEPAYVGYTALHFAAKAGNARAIELLLLRGADPTLKNRASYSPIRLAAETTSDRRCLDLQGPLSRPILDSLLTAQVAANIAKNASCKNGVSHFHLACMMDHDVAVTFFLDVAKVPVDLAVNRDSPILPGYTGLHFAVRYGSLQVVQTLLDKGADVTLCDAEGTTPLQLLIRRSLELADSSFVIVGRIFQKVLIDNEKILNLLISSYDSLKIDVGLSKLSLYVIYALIYQHQACTFTSKEKHLLSIEEIIVNKEADVNDAISFESPVCPGYTALHFAAHCSIQEFLLLVKYGANIAAKDAKGVTPFDLSVRNFRTEDVLCVIKSAESLKDIELTDGMKLSDALLMIKDSALFDEKRLVHQVKLDSPLWPGYTLLHLAVDFARNVDLPVNILTNYDDNQIHMSSAAHTSDKVINLHRQVAQGYLRFDNTSTPTNRADNLSFRRVVQECLKFDRVSTQNANGMTALHLAFRQQKKDLVNILLNEIHRNGMTTNPSDFGNLSHLHIMSVEGRATTISNYLNRPDVSVDLNSATQSSFKYMSLSVPIFVKPNSTALHLAVIFQEPSVVELLLQHGADPLVKDSDGMTPLHLMFLNGCTNESMRELLLPVYKSRNVNPVSSEGLSHFHIACFFNDLSLAKELLVSELADPEASINCGLRDTYEDAQNAFKNSVYYTSERDCSDHFVQLAPYSGFRALHMAVEGEAFEVVDLLVSHGADAHAQNTAGLSPLQLALRRVNRSQRTRDIVNRLIERAKGLYGGLTRLHIACAFQNRLAIKDALDADVDINAQLSLSSPIWPGSTALHLVLQNDMLTDARKSIVKLFVKRGANVNQLNAENLTPIHVAFNRNWLDAVKTMLRSSHILESNPKDDEDFSHFHIACCFSENSLVEDYLVRGLANVNCPKDYFAENDCAGFTPIYYALANRNYSAVEVLLRHGANVRTESRYGSTILHIANYDVASSDRLAHEYAILKCIEANANVNAVDIFGKTPLEICLKNNIRHLVKLFVKHGARSTYVNPISREGTLALADSDAARIILENANDITEIDRITGFNAIHNIVSSDSINISSHELEPIIEHLIQKGCDIDMRDHEGKTPLHVAVLWKKSCVTVRVLLSFGADINIADNSGNTPLMYCTCYNKTRGDLITHIHAMFQFRYYLSEANQKQFNKLFDNFNNALELLNRHRGVLGELENPFEWQNHLTRLRNIVIFENCTLADLLDNTIVNRAYLRWNKSKREAIAKCLSLENMRKVGCPKTLVGLLRLQYRRCLNRMPMIEPAHFALQLCARPFLSNFRQLPHLCSESIIEYLTNEDLMNLIQTIR